MDRNTMIVLMFGIAIVGAGIFFATGASVERTKLQTDATVAKAQEHTKRSVDRHDLVDVIGFLRGWKRENKDQ